MDNNNGYNPNNNYDPNAGAGYNPNPTPGYDPNAAAGYNAYQTPGYNPNQYNPGGYNPYNPYGGEDQNSKTMAIISLVVGILSIPVTLWVQAIIGLLMAIAGIVLAAIPMKKLTSSKGFAIGGLIASIIAILIWVVVIAIACCFVASLGSSYYYY